MPTDPTTAMRRGETPACPYPGQLARLLRRAREERHWTVRELTARTGISHGYISLVELRQRMFLASHLALLARAFDRPAAELLLVGLQEKFHRLAAEYLPDDAAALRAPGCRLELRRPDGSLLSWQDLGTGESGIDLRPEERALEVSETGAPTTEAA